MMKNDLPVSEKAIILSSLLTQSLIGAKHSAEADKDALIDAVNVDLILDTLSAYIYEHDNHIVEDTFDAFQIIFKTLFPRKGKWIRYARVPVQILLTTTHNLPSILWVL